MSKFNANNLSYSKNLPPFLAALHGQYSDQRGDGPDPILAAQRRAVKVRSASEEVEDAPLVLDDHGDVVAGVAISKDGSATLTALETGAEVLEDAAPQQEERRNEPVDGVADIGLGKKKKRAGKVVGGTGDVSDKGGKDKGVADARQPKRKWQMDDDGEPQTGHKHTSTHDGSRRAAMTNPRHGPHWPGRSSSSGESKALGAPSKKKKKAKKIQLSFEDDDDAEG